MALFDKTTDDHGSDGNSHFVDRRRKAVGEALRSERRQFGNTHFGLSSDALELAQAIDNYKMKNRRRFITCEEMLQVIQSLGYRKHETALQANSS